MILCESYSPRQPSPETSLLIDGLAHPGAAVARGFGIGLKPPPPVDLLEWAKKNVTFAPTDPFPGAYDPALFPFYTEILRRLEPNDPSREVILKGSAQTGKTIVAQVFTGGCIDLDPGPMLYIHPSLENGRSWVNTKWKPFVRLSPSLRRILPQEKVKDTANQTLYKERLDGRGHLLVRGANSPEGLSMISYPRQVQDDLAKWENTDAGDPEGLADSRSQAYEYAKIFKISTPMIEGACRISNNFKRSDQRFWQVPCPHCEHKHALEWENFKQSLTDGMNPLDAHFTCAECGGVIEHHHKEAMVAAGQWIPANPASRIPGYHIWTAYSPLISWARIAEEWFKAKGAPEAEHRFYNDVLGLEYSQQGEAPPWKEIKARAENSDYDSGLIPAGALILSIGCDVQGDRVEWLLKGFGPNLQRFTIQHGVIDGHISEQRTRDALDKLLTREWKNGYGRKLKADMLAIDGNYETNDVKDWAKKWPESRVIIVRGANSHHAPPLAVVKYDRNNAGKTIKRQRRFFHVGVSGLKAALYNHLAKSDPLARGYCGFPRDLTEDYYLQLCSEKRVPKRKSNGAIDLVWERLPNVRNEILDMEIQAEAAARRLGWHNLSDKDWDLLREQRESPPPAAQLDLLEPSIVPQAQPPAPPEPKPAAPAPSARLPKPQRNSRVVARFFNP